MKVERRMLGNVAVLGTGELLAQFSNFVFVVVIARAFGPGLLGHYSLSMAVAAIVMVFISFGTLQLHVRNIGRNAHEGGELLRTLFPVQVLLAFVAWIGIISVGTAFRLSPTELGVLAAIAAYQFLVRLMGILLTEPQGRQQMRAVAIAHAGLPIATLCATGFLVWLNYDPVVTLSVLPCFALMFVLFAARTAAQLGGPIRLHWNACAVVAGVREARPFFAAMLLSSAYERLGIIILGLFASSEMVGEFAAGERIVAALGVVVGVVTTVALPALSSLAASDKVRLMQVANRLVRLAWLFGLPLATVISLFKSEIIDLVFGESYSGSSAVLGIVSVLIAIRAIRAVLAPMAMATGQPGLLVFARATALLTLICGAPLLVNGYGAQGLAATMVLAETILLAVLATRLAASGNLPEIVSPALRIAGACGAAYAVGLLVVEWPLAQRVTAALFAGLSGLWAFRAVRANDIEFVMTLIRTGAPSDEGAQD